MASRWQNTLRGVLLLILTLAAACARVPPTPPRERPAVTSAQDLISRLQDRAREVQSFTAKGRVTVLTPERRYNGSALITAVKPATLRVDVLSFFGQPLVTFYTDGQEVRLFAYTEGKVYRGPATSRNLALFIPPQVTVPEVIAFMSGSAPLKAAAEAQLAPEPEGNQYRVELGSPGAADRLTLWVGDQDLELRAVQWQDDRGQVLYRVEFQDFTLRGPTPQPQQVNLTSDAGDRRIRLHFLDFTPNPAQITGLLTLPTGEGLRETVLP